MARMNLERLESELKKFGIAMRDIVCAERVAGVPEVEIRGYLVSPSRLDNNAPYTPARILKSGKATIVFWNDGTKTVVKRGEDEPDSDYNAFLAALGIKYFGSNSALKRIVARTETQKQKDQIGSNKI